MTIEEVPASGSCSRCQRALDLAAIKVRGQWYGNAACAEGGDCPLEGQSTAVDEALLYPTPKRFFRKRRPRELR